MSEEKKIEAKKHKEHEDCSVKNENIKEEIKECCSSENKSKEENIQSNNKKDNS